MQKLVKTGMPQDLPNKMSFLQLVKYKPKVQPINWQETRKQGKHIRHNNLHTGGYQTFLRWSKRNTNFRNDFLWSFTPTRTHKRKTINNYIMEHGANHLVEV
jgi:hypothetical protein